ncbi:biotin transporter BioY [Propioniciclava sinopodophylli]|uniref:Biotin transporter n=1 Tax=Propioniciclava sinopodophylli TaxID=1837344 RepID=A0A4Q9KFJ7_9ACTN|nr:biotin transporter BioY [Propioniciclava sinopodophylli]TBT84717.1 biotin transporter BioY [Propioniciclava sinopodophylli]
MNQRRPSTVTDLALVAVFAGVISAATLAPAIPVGPVGVPITLQTLAVALTAMILGPWRGFAATALYVIVGLAGLPVFAGGASGLGVLAKPSAGYLLAFPLAALLIGFLTRIVLTRTEGRNGLRWALLLLAGLAGSFAFVHPMGIAGIALNAGLPLDKAFLADLVYWPGDIIKNIAASFVALAVHRAFPGLLVHPSVQLDQLPEAVRS